MRNIEDLLPEALRDEYLTDDYVNVCFSTIRYRGGTREDALVLCVKELVKVRSTLLKELKDQTWLKQPVIIYRDPPK